MPVYKPRTFLSGITVNMAMRRHFPRLDGLTSIIDCVRALLKNKTNAALVTDASETPLGVISKTDIMTAYYGELPIQTPIHDMMVGPPVVCRQEDTVENALTLMEKKGIHRIYVQETDSNIIQGVLAYSDIVGLVCKHCWSCGRSHRKRHPDIDSQQLTARDVMTPEVISCNDDTQISHVIEMLSSLKIGAVTVTDHLKNPRGVISKTDLNLAYIHGISLDAPARQIMKAPMVGVTTDTPIGDVMIKMMVSDVQRLFVLDKTSETLMGAISLSDVARFRSGTCKACATSRLMV